MRAALLAVVIVFGGLLSEAAKAQTFCAVNNQGATNCSFTSVERCRNEVQGRRRVLHSAGSGRAPAAARRRSAAPTSRRIRPICGCSRRTGSSIATCSFAAAAEAARIRAPCSLAVRLLLTRPTSEEQWPHRNANLQANPPQVCSQACSKSAAKPAGARILVVEARFYNDISDALLAGAAKALDEAKASWDIITVPGSLEIVPAIAIAVDAAEKQKKPYDGVVALGCVIQGETFHFDIVAMQSARALLDFSIERRLPCGNGILTTDNEAQAWARARLTEQDKGGDAARAALALICAQTPARAEITHGQSGTIERRTPRQPPRRGAARRGAGALPDGPRRDAAQRDPRRSSRRTGSAARSRARNTCRPRPRISATS